MWRNLDEGVISFQKSDKHKMLFSDFIEIQKLLELFDQSKSVIFNKVKMQKGKGNEYEYYDRKNLPNFISIGQLTEAIQKLGNEDLEFYHLDFDLDNDFNILVYENSLYMTFLKNTENKFNEFVFRILFEIEKFEFEIGYELLNTMVENPNKIFKINSDGEVIKFYNTMEEYRKA
jgi:hypothetical protein